MFVAPKVPNSNNGTFGNYSHASSRLGAGWTVDIHGRHHGWTRDAANLELIRPCASRDDSERSRPWTSKWSGHGCSELRTDKAADVSMVGRRCSELRTDSTTDVTIVGPWMLSEGSDHGWAKGALISEQSGPWTSSWMR